MKTSDEEMRELLEEVLLTKTDEERRQMVERLMSKANVFMTVATREKWRMEQRRQYGKKALRSANVETSI